MLDVGGIPQGDYAPVPFVLSSRGWAAWVDNDGHGVRFDLGDEVVLSHARRRRAAARAPVHARVARRATARVPARHGVLPARPARVGVRVLEEPRRLPAPARRRSRLRRAPRARHPLDAVVLDSPWATQYNTWEFNPHQFPDARGYIRRLRDDGVRTVVWVAPWVNLDSREGQYPPDDESARLHREPAPNYEPRHFVRDANGDPLVAKWWMGKGSPVDLHERGRRGVVARAGQAGAGLGVEGIKADDGEGWYIPDDARFADGTTGAQAAWGHGLEYRRSMQRAGRGAPGRRRALRPAGVDGPAGGRDHVGRGSAERLLVPADAGRRDAHRGRDRLQQLVARRRGLSGRAARRARRRRSCSPAGSSSAASRR